MSKVKNYLIFLVWMIAVVILIILSFKYNDSSSAILAEVSPQKYAVSFPKAVKVKEIFVMPGQRIRKGDKLIQVERADLMLEIERNEIALMGLKAEYERKTLEKNNRWSQAVMNEELQQLKMDMEIEQLKMTITSNQELAGNFSVMQLAFDTSTVLNQPYFITKKKQLEDEKSFLKKQLQWEKKAIDQMYALDITTMENEIQQLEKEVQLLKMEENELTQYAHIDGTVGNLFSEIQELVPPYSTILSLYEDNPSVIRALINEHHGLRIETGDEVIVESTNRTYKIQGFVTEIGSRIIEYPERLKQFRELPVWGREIFIKIPQENKFLNGEKVFVILDRND